MKSPFPRIGITFDVDGIKSDHYVYYARKLFTKNLNPRPREVSISVEGNTAAMLKRRANEFCSGVYRSDLASDYVRKILEKMNELGLTAFYRRFLGKKTLLIINPWLYLDN